MSPWRTLQCRKPGAVEPRARQRQHVERNIEAEPALDVRAEQFQHAAGAGAEIEQRADRPVGERGADRVLHRFVGDMQLADAIPLGGVAAEIGLRGGRARGAHRRQPLAVARHASDRPDRAARARRAPLRRRPPCSAEPEERPGAFAKALDQAGFGQQLEMARDARLRLAQNLGEVGDRQFGFGQQREDAQPRRLAGGLEGGVQGGERQFATGADIGKPSFTSRISGYPTTYKDIFIRLNRA